MHILTTYKMQIKVIYTNLIEILIIKKITSHVLKFYQFKFFLHKYVLSLWSWSLVFTTQANLIDIKNQLNTVLLKIEEKTLEVRKISFVKNTQLILL